MSQIHMTKKLDDSKLSNFKEPQYWGFANFPNQVFRRAVKNGFDFTLMVVGRSGLGKSTFINTLFLAEINDLKEQDIVLPQGSTVRMDEKMVKLTENGVTLNLTLVDTPGFGDAVNNNKCWEPIIQYVENKFLDYFCEETKVERSESIPDHCVHLCLYFIEPSGHGLKPIDIEFMKQLHGRVNIVPVIAKADCLTKDELTRFKKQVASDIKSNNIKLYQFPDPDDSDAPNALDILNSKIPFAVVGSNMLKEDNGKKYRYREYPWGVVEVENMAHNDFIPLRDAIVRKNLIDLIDVTHSVHYENFRYRQMDKLPKNATDRDPFTQMEEERRQKERELNDKKSNLDKAFEEKIRDRRSKIERRNVDLAKREADLRKEVECRKVEIEKLRAEIDEQRRGSTSDSKSSLHANENYGKTSPDKTKKKTGTLSTLFTRNN